MNSELMNEANDRWSSGDALEVGRLIYDHLPNDERPFWAAAILDLCRSLIPRVTEIDVSLPLERSSRCFPAGPQAYLES
jgi:hypothetical protein